MPRTPKTDPADLVDDNGVSLADVAPEPDPVEPESAPSSETTDDTTDDNLAVADDAPALVQLVHPDSDQVIESDPDHVGTWTASGWYLKPTDDPEPELADVTADEIVDDPQPGTSGGEPAGDTEGDRPADLAKK